MLKKYKTKILENISETSSGGTPSRDNADFYKGDIPWITTGELKDGYIFDSQEHITKEALKNSAAKIFPTGTVLMAMYGATIGRLGILKVDAATNQACCAFFPNEQKLKAKYLFYWLFYHRSQLIDMGTGAGQPNISQNIIKKLEIDLPTIQEQDEIVNALSDIDNLISTQEALIAKKQAIKQGAMQELLTGKRCKLVRKRLSDLVSMKSGETITAKSISNEGEYPCYGGNGLRGYTATYTHDGSYALVGRQGALCGNVNFSTGKFFASEHAVVVKPLESTDIKFMYYLLKQMNLNQYATSSAQPGLAVNKILELECVVPVDKEQQSDIAEILSDMDKDIANQQAKLEKLRRIKSGMMDKLLTGKIRLTD